MPTASPKYELARRYGESIVANPEHYKAIHREMDANPDDKCLDIAAYLASHENGMGAPGFSNGFHFAMAILYPAKTPKLEAILEQFIAEICTHHSNKTINFSAYLKQRKK